MHKAGGECLTWDSCEIPAEEEERVDPRERTALNISFSESPVSGGRFPEMEEVQDEKQRAHRVRG